MPTAKPPTSPERPLAVWIGRIIRDDRTSDRLLAGVLFFLFLSTVLS